MAFSRLSNQIKMTSSIADGWQVGRLIIEDGIFLEQDGDLVPTLKRAIVEILNDNEWYRLIEGDLQRKTVEGWPLFAGFDARMKIL